MEKKPEKQKRSLLLRILMPLVSAAVFLFAGSQLLSYVQENRQSDAVQSQLADQAVTVIVPTTVPAHTVPAEPLETEAADSAEETQHYPEISYEIPVRVDFEALQAECSDIVGWLYCAGTPLNHPVVQAEDNDYYLYRLPDGSSNANGTIFMDFRNLSDMTDRNTLIYGHNMSNGAMFAFLKNYRQQEYFEEHPVMWYLTPERAYRLDLLAGLVTPSDSDTYELFNSDEELMEHLKAAVQDSTFRSDVDLTQVGQVVTLSTCTYEYATARYVVIGSLTPAEYPPEEVPEATEE